MADSIKEMDKNPLLAGQKITLDGHTDSRGSSDYNMTLSENRAKAIKAELVAQGIPEDRIELNFHGKDKPKVLNEFENKKDNIAGRAVNRRVEIGVDASGLESEAKLKLIAERIEKIVIEKIPQKPAIVPAPAETPKPTTPPTQGAQANTSIQAGIQTGSEAKSKLAENTVAGAQAIPTKSDAAQAFGGDFSSFNRPTQASASQYGGLFDLTGAKAFDQPVAATRSGSFGQGYAGDLLNSRASGSQYGGFYNVPGSPTMGQATAGSAFRS
jgi:hypothetical protein